MPPYTTRGGSGSTGASNINWSGYFNYRESLGLGGYTQRDTQGYQSSWDATHEDVLRDGLGTRLRRAASRTLEAASDAVDPDRHAEARGLRGTGDTKLKSPFERLKLHNKLNKGRLKR